MPCYNIGKREEDIKWDRGITFLGQRFGQFVGIGMGKRCKIKIQVKIMSTSLRKSIDSILGPWSLASNAFRMEVNGAKMLPERDKGGL